jgi:protocatechuate 3,4-dioxygenase beta subunit
LKQRIALPSKTLASTFWHEDGLGLYSGYARQETGSTKGETFLRGTQFTGADGDVRFATIYPGWYPGRTPHIHFKAFVDDRNVITGQLYFPDPITDHVYATSPPYRERKAQRDTFNVTSFSRSKEEPTRP